MTNPHTPTKAGEAASEPDFNEIWRQCLRDAHFSYGPLPRFAETFGRAVIAALAPSPADRAASVVALEQLAQRIEDAQGCSPLVISVDAAKAIRAALATPQALPTPQAERSDTERELIAAAQAVIERWDTPAWKDAPHTAIFINRMREAIDAAMHTTAAATSEGAKS